MRQNSITVLLVMIVLIQSAQIYSLHLKVEKLDYYIEDRALAKNVAQSLDYIHFELNELKGQFIGTVEIAEAAWDMANPKHKPSELSTLSTLSEEQLDSIWEERHQ